MTYRVIAAATNHPDPINPYYGLFNARSLTALIDRSVDIDVVTPRPFAPPIGPYSEFNKIPMTSQYNGYEVHHPRFFYGLPKRLFYSLSGRSYAKRVPKYVDQEFEIPEVVHAYHIYPDGYGMLPYCRANDVPLVAVAHGTILNKYSSYSRNVRSHIKETLESCEMLLCVSEILKKRATEICPELEASVVPIGADPDRFPITHSHEIRNELDIPTDAPVILFCGAFIQEKGVDEIIEILPELVNTNAHFLFVGHDGERRTALQQAIIECGMSNRASVMYDISPLALRRLFAIADLFLLPSHSEGRPTVIYEAMASRTAVLASNVGGIPEQVSEGETGVLIPPKDSKLLLDKLYTLLDDIGKLQNMGDKGYQKLLNEEWTWDDHAEKVITEHKAVVE